MGAAASLARRRGNRSADSVALVETLEVDESDI